MRGKLVIVGIFVVAIGAATFAWWWNYQRAARARAFWGEQATTIRFADKVEALWLIGPEEAPSETADEIKIGDRKVPVREALNVSGAPGLLNARASLMVDESFDWSEPPRQPSEEDDWEFGVRFEHAGKTVTLLFDRQSSWTTVAETNQAVLLQEKTAEGWKGYLERALTRPLAN